MDNQINIASHPYGLSGGTILSGSVSISGEAFWYYPVTTAVATIKFNNMVDAGGSPASMSSVSLPAGTSVYGVITSVTQSSGVAILYSGSANIPRY